MAKARGFTAYWVRIIEDFYDWNVHFRVNGKEKTVYPRGISQFFLSCTLDSVQSKGIQ